MEDNNHSAQTIINVAGDYVQSKHVDYEIGNVEQGGIGIQIVQGDASKTADTSTVSVQSATSRSKPQQPPKRTVAPYTSATFYYRYAQQYPDRITRLYQYLLKAQWIASDTKPEDFNALFLGDPTHIKIKWIGTQQNLYYLIRTLVDREIISIPENATIWQIVECHFLNKDSRTFRNFNKQKEPTRTKLAIDNMVNLIDPSFQE